MNPGEIIYHLKSAVGAFPWTRPQVFDVCVKTTVINSCKEERSFEAILPLPQCRAGQSLARPFVFSVPETKCTQDEYGNIYALWKGTLKGDERRTASIDCPVRVSPSRGSRRTENEKDVFLASNTYVSAEKVQEIASRLREFNPSVSAYIRAAYEYVVSKLVYGSPIRGLYSVEMALKNPEVDCGGFDTLFCSLLIARGVPARVVSGFWAGGDATSSMHAWCEYMLDGVWIPADPSVSHLVRNGRDRTRSGKLGFVGSDRILFSVGCDMVIQTGERGMRTDILQHPFLIDGDPDCALTSQYTATRL